MKLKQSLTAFFISGMFVVAAHAQGTIDFMNRNIPGANGGPSYNVPLWSFGHVGTQGAGVLPGGVTVGLFEANGATPLVTSLLRSDTPLNAAFFATSVQTATTSSSAGSTPILTVRAWQTSAGSFVAAQSTGLQWAEWSFTSQPLGGTPPGGGLPIPTPGMTGWGPGPAAQGFEMMPEPGMIVLSALGLGTLFLSRRGTRR